MNETRIEKRKRIESYAYLNNILVYDAADGNLYWKVLFPGKVAGTVVKSPPFIKLALERLDFKAHRLCWTLHTKEAIPDGFVVDHINGNPFDNRASNLRVCLQIDNSRNCATPKNNTSGYKGVSFIQKFGVYRSYICVNRKQLHLGVYETAEQAAVAYNKAASEHFGPFAKLNVITKENSPNPTL